VKYTEQSRLTIGIARISSTPRFHKARIKRYVNSQGDKIIWQKKQMLRNECRETNAEKQIYGTVK